ncbi:hypothetical protein CACET_c32120 [Clostridium aceticum]|uniref:Uncharacterized protein n=1 Tax=Clostridium aceticum TaxID=84022 RepID=A0A0G3WDD2_9CLOT|nr:hypothetical protein [Clostridium aceticum]AKL96656.1 hypothetical protein CACET_c32120 [Clostridium aceticum]
MEKMVALAIWIIFVFILIVSLIVRAGREERTMLILIGLISILIAIKNLWFA